MNALADPRLQPRRAGLFLATALAALASVPVGAAERLDVHVANYPLAYFAERIGGDQVEVTLPVPADEDPAFWEPDGEAMHAYQQADLVLLNGAGYAKWVDYASLRHSRIVVTGAAFEKRWISADHAASHSHGPEGEHSHGDWAFTTWLDPQLAAAQAREISRALAEARPGHVADFEAGLATLISDLDALDAELTAITKAIGDQPLLFSHPVYQYLEQRYHLNGRSVHWEPQEIPDDSMWEDLDRLLAEHAARCMIWEGEPDAEAVDGLAERGITALVFDPAGNRPQTGDYLSVMKQNLERLERIAIRLEVGSTP